MNDRFYDRFPIPLADANDAGAPPEGKATAVDRARGNARRLLRGRRLAVLDTHFPWRLSGVRFHEFSEIHRQRPETVFFSLHRMTEPFQVPVHPLADFPRLAPLLGVTDIYAVFLNFVVGLLGLGDDAEAAGVPGVRCDISIVETLRRHSIRSHVTIYPGGGLVADTPLELIRAVADRADTVFTNVAEVEATAPVRHSHAVTATRFYTPSERAQSDTLRLVFAADDRPRKGLQTLIEAFNTLSDGFHLDLVGPHRRHLPKLTNPHVTFHGWLDPASLRDVYQRADVFVSPVAADTACDEGGEPGMSDGFPTSTAIDAVATGCALITSNPRGETRVFRPDVHYLAIPPRDPAALASALRRLRDDAELRQRLAESGMLRVRERMSVDRGVREKLAVMGITS